VAERSEKDGAIYENDFPMKYTRNEQAPLLALQGENDPRVPKEEAEQVVEIPSRKAAWSTYIIIPMKGHSFGKHED
jgi:dipeptidyl aminopeptidase/acylaminoacyl peptidase